MHSTRKHVLHSLAALNFYGRQYWQGLTTNDTKLGLSFRLRKDICLTQGIGSWRSSYRVSQKCLNGSVGSAVSANMCLSSCRRHESHYPSVILAVTFKSFVIHSLELTVRKSKKRQLRFENKLIPYRLERCCGRSLRRTWRLTRCSAESK